LLPGIRSAFSSVEYAFPTRVPFIVFIGERVLKVQDGLFQGVFGDVVVVRVSDRTPFYRSWNADL
jgi:hypothetical protein